MITSSIRTTDSSIVIHEDSLVSEQDIVSMGSDIKVYDTGLGLLT